VDTETDADDKMDQSTDETLKTEHDVTNVQQVDAAQGVAGTGDEQHGKEVCIAITLWHMIDFLHYFAPLKRDHLILKSRACWTYCYRASH